MPRRSTPPFAPAASVSVVALSMPVLALLGALVLSCTGGNASGAGDAAAPDGRSDALPLRATLTADSPVVFVGSPVSLSFALDRRCDQGYVVLAPHGAARTDALVRRSLPGAPAGRVELPTEGVDLGAVPGASLDVARYVNAKTRTLWPGRYVARIDGCDPGSAPSAEAVFTVAYDKLSRFTLDETVATYETFPGMDAASRTKTIAECQRAHAESGIVEEDRGAAGALRCAERWPQAGVMMKLTATERFRQVLSSAQTIERTYRRVFWIHSPVDPRKGGATPAEKLPAFIALHGGDGTGLEVALTQRLPLLGSGGVARTRRNTEGCRVGFAPRFTERPRLGSITLEYEQRLSAPDGTPCADDALATVDLTATHPFLSVFPDALPDDLDGDGAPDTVVDPDGEPGVRSGHWQDGRAPSPGWEETVWKGGENLGAEQADDLGFVSHIIETLRVRFPGVLDPERVYVTGVSNGGLMTARLACNANNPKYPPLRTIAAFAEIAGGMAATLRPGTLPSERLGREECGLFPGSPRHEIPLALFLGDGLPSPQCGHLLPAPYSANKEAIRAAFNGCIKKRNDGKGGPFGNGYLFEAVNGDGRQVFGEAGKVYYGYNLNMSPKLSQPDQLGLWVKHHEALGLAARRTGRARLPGTFYTSAERVLFDGAATELLLFVTEGGAHVSNGGRGDGNIVGRALSFLSRFRRDGRTFAIARDDARAIIAGEP